MVGCGSRYQWAGHSSILQRVMIKLLELQYETVVNAGKAKRGFSVMSAFICRNIRILNSFGIKSCVHVVLGRTIGSYAATFNSSTRHRSKARLIPMRTLRIIVGLWGTSSSRRKSIDETSTRQNRLSAFFATRRSLNTMQILSRIAIHIVYGPLLT